VSSSVVAGPTTTPVRSSTAPTPTAPTVPADVPSTGPNTKPGERPPVMPAMATRHTAAGAKAFAEFFIKTIDWGYATTSSTYMRHYFARTCIDCLSVANALDYDRNRGHRYIGDRFSIVRSTEPTPTGSTYQLHLELDVTASEVVDKNGNFVDGEGALNDYDELLRLAWSSRGWTISDMSHK